MKLFVLPKRKLGLFIISGSVLFGLGVGGIVQFHRLSVQADALQQQTDQSYQAFFKALKNYQTLRTHLSDAEKQGIDVGEVKVLLPPILAAFRDHNFILADQKIKAAMLLLDQKIAAARSALEAQKKAEEDAKAAAAEAEKQKGDLKGKVSEGSNGLNAVTVSLVSGKVTVAKATTDKDGLYAIHFTSGKYTVSFAKSGYTTQSKTNVEIKAQATTTLDVTLTKAPPPPPPATSSDSSATSNYTKTTVTTSRGTFSAHILTVTLDGRAHVKTDTAADSDCSDNCPTKSLQSYVSGNSGFAGINGTYFCPADYADCAGKTNTFYWKVYTSRLNKIINEHNGLGEDDPAFVFTADGKAHFFNAWKSFVASGLSITAGINSRPILVQSGQNVLNESQLDDKQRTTKSNRGALGLKGDTFYAVVAQGATVIDLAEIMHSLGVDSAMNIDGGGSSALYYKGGYKVGPGRSLPNAVIFTE